MTFQLESITVSSRVYAQSVSSHIRQHEEVCVIAIYELHWVTQDFKITFDGNWGMRAVENWAYRREDTVSFSWPYLIHCYVWTLAYVPVNKYPIFTTPPLLGALLPLEFGNARVKPSHKSKPQAHIFRINAS